MEKIEDENCAGTVFFVNSEVFQKLLELQSQQIDGSTILITGIEVPK